jgi:hypothetical protein
MWSLSEIQAASARLALAGDAKFGARQVEQEYGIRIGPENRQFRDFSQLCRELGEPEQVVATAWVL